MLLAVATALCFATDRAEPPAAWQLAICVAAWAGLLGLALGAVSLRILPRSIPVREAVFVGFTGLVLTSVLALVAPDTRLLEWEVSMQSRQVVDGVGPIGIAFASGMLGGLVAGALGAIAATVCGFDLRPGWGYAAMFLSLLLLPAVALMTHDDPISVSSVWSAGVVGGAFAGVRMGAWCRFR